MQNRTNFTPPHALLRPVIKSRWFGFWLPVRHPPWWAIPRRPGAGVPLFVFVVVIIVLIDIDLPSRWFVLLSPLFPWDFRHGWQKLGLGLRRWLAHRRQRRRMMRRFRGVIVVVGASLIVPPGLGRAAPVPVARG